MSTITSANSVLTLSITNLYASPQTIQGWSADDAFASDAMELAETVAGIDCKLSGGYVYNPVNMTITIMPNSESQTIFETWVSATKVVREIYTANGYISLPAIRKKYTLTNGILVSAKPFPDVKKTLQPTPFIIRWESVVGAPY